MAGCGLTGMCSSVYSRGVTVLAKTIKDMSKWMDNKGYASIKDFQNCAVKEFMYLRDWPREDPMAVETRSYLSSTLRSATPAAPARSYVHMVLLLTARRARKAACRH